MASSGNKLKCLVVDDEPMARQVLVALIERTPTLDLIGEVDNAFDALDRIQNTAIDLVFLDVEMPGMTGLDLLKGVTNLPSVVLTTSHADYAVEAFDFDVLDFLLKPVDPSRFLKAVDKAVAEVPRGDDSMLFIKDDHGYTRVNLEEVLYLEAYGDFVKVFFGSGRKVFRAKMKDLEESLPSSFIRTHRSYIVNAKHIMRVEDSSVMVDTTSIPMGRTYRNKVMELVR